MLDIQFIRDNRQRVEDSLKGKNIKANLDKLFELDDERRKLTAEIDVVRQKRNELAGKIGKGKPTEEEIRAGKDLKAQDAELSEKLEPVEKDFQSLLKEVPNIYTEDTPVGASEDENVIDYEWGDKPKFDFEVKNHWQIAQQNNWIDKERAAKVSGARFAYIKGSLVLLQQAIINFTLSTLTDSTKLQTIIDEFKVDGVSDTPFTPILPPLMLKTEVFDAMDRLEPREDRYKIDGEELWLQGSAEHVMGSMHMDELLDEDQLPLRYVGFASSFRKEAGTYGKDMEGIFRMHQFDKLEMEIISTPETGLAEHMFTIAIQEHLMRQLEIPYHKLTKCTADIGKPNARGVDLEAWLPGQNKFRETHTADYMTDYQSRRLKTRYKNKDGDNILVYTIDATAFALGRTMIAIIENNQTKEGKVKVPTVLQPYLNKEIIG